MEAHRVAPRRRMMWRCLRPSNLQLGGAGWRASRRVDGGADRQTILLLDGRDGGACHAGGRHGPLQMLPTVSETSPAAVTKHGILCPMALLDRVRWGPPSDGVGWVSESWLAGWLLRTGEPRLDSTSSTRGVPSVLWEEIQPDWMPGQEKLRR